LYERTLCAIVLRHMTENIAHRGRSYRRSQDVFRNAWNRANKVAEFRHRATLRANTYTAYPTLAKPHGAKHCPPLPAPIEIPALVQMAPMKGRNQRWPRPGDRKPRHTRRSASDQATFANPTRSAPRAAARWQPRRLVAPRKSRNRATKTATTGTQCLNYIALAGAMTLGGYAAPSDTSPPRDTSRILPCTTIPFAAGLI
jgi:hypothetical protein